jgi:hypothetical protein
VWLHLVGRNCTGLRLRVPGIVQSVLYEYGRLLLLLLTTESSEALRLERYLLACRRSGGGGLLPTVNQLRDLLHLYHPTRGFPIFGKSVCVIVVILQNKVFKIQDFNIQHVVQTHNKEIQYYEVSNFIFGAV